MVEALIEMRVHADSLVYSMDNDLPKSAETVKAVNSLKLGRCWMGKLLGLLNEENPYKNDGNRHTVSDIEKAVHTSVHHRDLSKMSQVERIDWVRQDLSLLQKDFDTLVHSADTPNIAISTSLVSVFQHLAEARFWLGYELGRLRDTSSKLP